VAPVAQHFRRSRDIPSSSAEAAGGVKWSPSGPSVSSPRSGPLDAGGRPELAPCHVARRAETDCAFYARRCGTWH
jgi:hypothetical protein